jgi:hypothetical protein
MFEPCDFQKSMLQKRFSHDDDAAVVGRQARLMHGDVY